ncbi:hypothetical protein ADL03_29380 [Nocardia sp. NRRL S-836]|nr:hypothetical protein ADL03_29380 [Nocardia sp. NRRL S-836]
MLAGVLAGVSNLLPMYTVMHTSPVDAFAWDGSLWVPSSATPAAERDVSPLLNAGTPVLVTLVVAVVAGLLALRRDRIAPPARVVALAAAAAFLGAVVAYGVGVLRDEEMVNAFDAGATPPFAYHFNSGFYLLVAAAVLALTGAVLVQRPRPAAPEPDDDAVVVHQMTDDDTPPFGLAIPMTGEPRGD